MSAPFPELATKARFRFDVMATLTGSLPTGISTNLRIFFFVVVKALTESLSEFTLTSTMPSLLCTMRLD